VGFRGGSRGIIVWFLWRWPWCGLSGLGYFAPNGVGGLEFARFYTCSLTPLLHQARSNDVTPWQKRRGRARKTSNSLIARRIARCRVPSSCAVRPVGAELPTDPRLRHVHSARRGEILATEAGDFERRRVAGHRDGSGKDRERGMEVRCRNGLGCVVRGLRPSAGQIGWNSFPCRPLILHSPPRSPGSNNWFWFQN
jgi:hypothetical protein